MDIQPPATAPVGPSYAVKSITRTRFPFPSTSATLLFLILGAYLRFRGIFDRGIAGTDTFRYVEVARQWRLGNFILNDIAADPVQHFRPAFYGLGTLFYFLFGVHDYSLRLGMAGVDLANAGLVWLIARRLASNPWAAAFSVGLYCLSPEPLFYARSELIHTTTTFFLLLCLWFFVTRHLRWSGVSLGLAALTHGEMIFFAPGIFLTLFLRREKVLRFAVGLVVPYVLAGVAFGFSPLVHSLIGESQIFGGEPLPWLNRWYLTAWRSLSDISSRLCVALFFLLGIASPFLFWVVSHLVVFTLLLPKVFLSRLFIPLCPLLFLGIFLSWPRLSTRVMTVLFFALLAANVLERQTTWRAALATEPTPVRFAWNQVPQTAHVLVAPSNYYQARRQFNSSLYFGDRAFYLYDCVGGLEEFVQRHAIQFVFIGVDTDERILVDKSLSRGLGRCYGWNNYTVARETRELTEFLRKRGAMLRWQSSQGDKIYELPVAQVAHSEFQ